jgi:hypothetical protein
VKWKLYEKNFRKDVSATEDPKMAVSGEEL